ncbi:ribonucleoside-diphosphate reductase small chain [Escherichia virus KFS-EC]|uniref:ribonucleoside-diphosphate reductase n=1 Tax=Escherichia virus KFS-EC TaxID=2250214 RepID=A0A345BS45_9CAUD|nr:ribonucleotide reductase class Ia beta subunit [Escherichia virus KFS-EC]AXF53266.1 ribonucleoside-diphosphate reductase small chain [Escherichia virus KFS-EC]
MSVFNREHVDIMNEPMFLGSGLGIARYDIQRHQVFEELIEKSLSFFWRPEEISLATDRIQYLNMGDVEKRFFTENLKYQTLLDSIQGRAPSAAFGPIVSDPTLDTWLQTWTFSETIHSRSYTHIMRNCFIDPASEFDQIIDNPAIMKRAESIGQYYDDVLVKIREYEDAKESFSRSSENEFDLDAYSDSISYVEETKRNLMDSLYLCMHCVNALEAIRFYVSFACTFSFAERGLLEGNAKIMKFIARDEQLHLKGTQYIIRQWQTGADGDEWKQIAEELEGEATKIFLDVVEQEKEWVDHLFAMGAIPGLSPEILKTYVEYLADSRMRAAGLKSPFSVRRHPLPWMRKWLNSDEVQNAAQEVEIMYLVSQVNTDLTDEDYNRFGKYL